MLDDCLAHPAIRERVWGILSDAESSGSVDVARRHGLDILLPAGGDAEEFGDDALSLCEARGIDWIISTGFTRIFRGEIVRAFHGRLLNTHFSILPAFPGTRGSDWTTDILPPRSIFERAIAYGSRMIGNTIHLVDASIDGGFPVMQSSMVVPYDEPVEDTRHRLYLQECRMLMQMVLWLSTDRLSMRSGMPRIEGATFQGNVCSPAIEEAWIEEFQIARG